MFAVEENTPVSLASGRSSKRGDGLRSRRVEHEPGRPRSIGLRATSTGKVQFLAAWRRLVRMGMACRRSLAAREAV
jgi:hypothetical protein